MPFLRKDLLRRYCNDVVDVCLGVDATAQLESSICKILNSAGDLVKKRGKSTIRKEDIMEVINNGIQHGQIKGEDNKD